MLSEGELTAEADGRLHEHELAALKYISEHLVADAKKGGLSAEALASMKKSLDAASGIVKFGAGTLVAGAGSVGAKLGAGLEMASRSFKKAEDAAGDDPAPEDKSI